MKNKEILIDVRSPAEFEGIHIKDSYNIPLEEFQKYSKEISKLNKKIVLICRTGNRAKTALKSLECEGCKEARVLEGGIVACKEDNYEFIKGKQKWEIERQVRLVAGSLVLIGILLGYFVSSKFFIFSGLIGFGLVVASLTNSCLMGMLLMKLPYNKSAKKIDVKKIIEELKK
jgi:rhodanese-related sulfurtransferase